MTQEQRAFVEKLLDYIVDVEVVSALGLRTLDLRERADASMRSRAAARRAEFELLFPREGTR